MTETLTAPGLAEFDLSLEELEAMDAPAWWHAALGAAAGIGVVALGVWIT